jgi:hypothetical protein
MAYFRKKPVVIEAIQWIGDSPEMRRIVRQFVDANLDERNAGLKIETLEGWMTVTSGDWIIKGVAGEFYPCKPDIFEATYEPVNIMLQQCPGYPNCICPNAQWSDERDIHGTFGAPGMVGG